MGGQHHRHSLQSPSNGFRSRQPVQQHIHGPEAATLVHSRPVAVNLARRHNKQTSFRRQVGISPVDQHTGPVFNQDQMELIVPVAGMFVCDPCPALDLQTGQPRGTPNFDFRNQNLPPLVLTVVIVLVRTKSHVGSYPHWQAELSDLKASQSLVDLPPVRARVSCQNQCHLCHLRGPRRRRDKLRPSRRRHSGFGAPAFGRVGDFQSDITSKAVDLASRAGFRPSCGRGFYAILLRSVRRPWGVLLGRLANLPDRMTFRNYCHRQKNFLRRGA